MFKSNSKSIVIISLVLLIYFAAFGFLFSKSSNYDGIFYYTDELLKALLAAGTVAALTSIIFVFQDRVEQRGKKEQEVFKVKIEFYSKLIVTLEAIEKDGDVDAEELQTLFFLTMRSVMFSSPEVFEAVVAYYDLCKETSNENTANNRYKLITEIAERARNNLEVQDPIPDHVRKEFLAKLEDIATHAFQMSEISKSERRQTRSISEKRKIVNEYDNYGDGRARWLKDTHNIVPAYIATWRKQIKLNDSGND